MPDWKEYKREEVEVVSQQIQAGLAKNSLSAFHWIKKGDRVYC
jgi:hypothetical protein